jgi:hypothetical protein
VGTWESDSSGGAGLTSDRCNHAAILSTSARSRAGSLIGPLGLFPNESGLSVSGSGPSGVGR